jgi:hypothetical protein
MPRDSRFHGNDREGAGSPSIDTLQRGDDEGQGSLLNASVLVVALQGLNGPLSPLACGFVSHFAPAGEVNDRLLEVPSLEIEKAPIYVDPGVVKCINLLAAFPICCPRERLREEGVRVAESVISHMQQSGFFLPKVNELKNVPLFESPE